MSLIIRAIAVLFSRVISLRIKYPCSILPIVDHKDTNNYLMICMINIKSYSHKPCENSYFNEDHFLGAEIDAFVLYKNAFPI